jgi:hypothetical protein
MDERPQNPPRAPQWENPNTTRGNCAGSNKQIVNVKQFTCRRDKPA